MRLPQPLLDSPFFQFGSFDELNRSLTGIWDQDEMDEAKRLTELNLPPITSVTALATMLGVNSGLIWSIRHRTNQYYSSFNIPKGKTFRRINAPRVVLKVIQKWISVHIQNSFKAPDHVHGFIPGKSHVTAAAVHCRANWTFSIDIEDFFPSTPEKNVIEAFQSLGYNKKSADLLSKITCINGGLAQGAPTSPILSNVCMASIDNQLASLASSLKLRLTRYADDIVFSGTDQPHKNLEQEIRSIIESGPWAVAENKVAFDILPAQLKVHGLLVHGNSVRLTKAYRNRLRTYNHLMHQGKIADHDLNYIRGHIEYGKFVDQISKEI